MTLSKHTDQYDWNNGARSQEIGLVAGEEYFVELIQKNGWGLGHADVAWSYQDYSYQNWAVDSASVATQSSTVSGAEAGRAIDGSTEGVFALESVTNTDASSAGNWWQVDLGQDRPIDHIVLWNRTIRSMTQLSNFRVSAQYPKTYTTDLLDFDQDDMKNDWESTRGFDPTAVQIGDYSPLADIDHDGLNNLLESKHNTNPFKKCGLPTLPSCAARENSKILDQTHLLGITMIQSCCDAFAALVG